MTRTRRGASSDNQELPVEGLSHRLSLFRPIVSLIGQSLQLGKLFHQLQYTDGIGGRDQGTIRLTGRILGVNQFKTLRRYTPITILVFGDNTIISILLHHMIHPSLDIRIAIDNGLSVPILTIDHLTGERKDGGPCHVIVIIVPEGRSHIADDTILALRLTDVTHPFGIEAFVVKQETLSERTHCAVAQPRLTLVALRTVDRHSLVVGLDAPPRILHHLCQGRVATLEHTC